jgi:anti-anti-sigma factor
MRYVKTKRIGTVVVVTPQRDLRGEDETFELDEKIRELEKEGNRHLVVNLDRVKTMASYGMDVLIEGHKRYKERGARMVLCSLKPTARNPIEIAKLAPEFKIFETEEEALAGFVEDIPTEDFEAPPPVKHE